MRNLIKGIVFLVLALAVITFGFMQQKSFGKNPTGDRLNRIETSKNYRNGSFQNLIETTVMSEDASYFKVMVSFFSKGVDREPLLALPTIKSDLKSTTVNTEVVWFGHSTFLISLQGKKILCDPVLSERPSPVQYAGSKAYNGTRIYSEVDIPDLDLIIITHDHYDHLDYGTIVALHGRTKRFCVPLGVGEHLQHWGVPNEKIIELDWWDQKSIEGIQVTATPARHFSGRGFQRNKTLWASYVVEAADQRLFIGGDSGYDDSFKKIGERFGPFDIAFLECGQYDVQWPSIHMMPEETVKASLDLKAKVLVPVHWAKFTLALHPWKEPIERALKEAANLDVSVATPQIGQRFKVGEAAPSSTWWRQF